MFMALHRLVDGYVKHFTHDNKIDLIKTYNLAHLVFVLERFKWYIEMEIVRLIMTIV